MSHVGGRRNRAECRPVVVIAGEDSTDRETLRLLLEARFPGLHGRLVEIGVTTGSLSAATGDNLAARVDKLVRIAKAKAAEQDSPLAALVVHGDHDRLHGPEYTSARQRLGKALAGRFKPTCLALAVWEIEAWLLLFPDAFGLYRAGWSIPRSFRNRNTGLLAPTSPTAIFWLTPKPWPMT